LVGIEEDAGASVSPKVAVAELAGVGRNGQAMAAAIQIARGVDGRKGGERVGLGWVGLTDLDPSQVGLAEPEWAGWASRPDGPNWLWPIDLKQNFKLKFKCYFLFEFKPNSKIQITLIKHFLNL
jgi:hypothetical protein